MVNASIGTSGVYRIGEQAPAARTRANAAVHWGGPARAVSLGSSYFGNGHYRGRARGSVLHTQKLRAKAVWGPKVH